MSNTDVAKAKVEALVTFTTQNPEAPVCGLAWSTAYLAGYATGLAECAVCEGTNRVKIEGHGWCRCPKCAAFTHYRHEGKPYCGNESSWALGTAADLLDDVTCVDCLQKRMRELEARIDGEA